MEILTVWNEIRKVRGAVTKVKPGQLGGETADAAAWWACALSRLAEKSGWVQRKLYQVMRRWVLMAMYRAASRVSVCPPDRIVQGGVYRIRIQPPTGERGWTLDLR